MHPLEKYRVEIKDMSIPEFCKWLGIAINTYRRIVKDSVGQIWVKVYLKIYKKTGMFFCDIHPKHDLCKIMKK